MLPRILEETWGTMMDHIKWRNSDSVGGGEHFHMAELWWSKYAMSMAIIIHTPPFFVFLKSSSTWCCWLLILFQSGLFEGHLIRLSLNGQQWSREEIFSHPHPQAFKLDTWSEVTSDDLHSFNIWFGKSCTENLIHDRFDYLYNYQIF